jgi:uncharacterized protein YegL
MAALVSIALPGMALATNLDGVVDWNANTLEDPGTVYSYGAGGDGTCDCIDLVLVVDDTGSMGGAISNIATGLIDVISTAETTCGDIQCGVITFADDVQVDQPLVAGTAGCSAAVAALFASGGAGLPEASDEALREAFTATVCALTGDFDPAAWRAGCCKVAILVTDAEPAGCDDTFSVGTDDVNAHARALEAAALGVQIGALFVPTGGDPSGTITPIMIDYAATTDGVFGQTNADGTGTSSAIEQVILNCIGAGDTELCCFPDGACTEVLVGQCEPGGGTLVADCAECGPVPTHQTTWGQIKSQSR